MKRWLKRRKEREKEGPIEKVVLFQHDLIDVIDVVVKGILMKGVVGDDERVLDVKMLMRT
jgi:hypothetical protein